MALIVDPCDEPVQEKISLGLELAQKLLCAALAGNLQLVVERLSGRYIEHPWRWGCGFPDI